MKTGISAGLLALKAAKVATLAMCWKVTRTDSTVFGFTTHVRDIVIGGVTYKSRGAFTPQEIETRADLSVDNLEVIGILSNVAPTESDLLGGKWDYAEFEIFEVNYLDVSMGTEKHRFGKLGNVLRLGGRFRAELRGLMQYLQTPVGKIAQRTCRARLGDAQCKVNTAPLTVVGTVSAIAGQTGMNATGLGSVPTGYYDNGDLTWTAGNNAGVLSHVRQYTGGGIFSLSIPVPYAIQIGDTFSVVAGCRKRLEDCRDKFSNVVNMDAEPYVIGMDKLLQVGRRE